MKKRRKKLRATIGTLPSLIPTKKELSQLPRGVREEIDEIIRKAWLDPPLGKPIFMGPEARAMYRKIRREGRRRTG